MSRRFPDYCNRTGKKRYIDAVAAKLFLAEVAHPRSHTRERSTKIPVREFYCVFCKGYHLTSLTQEQYDKKRMIASK